MALSPVFQGRGLTVIGEPLLCCRQEQRVRAGRGRLRKDRSRTSKGHANQPTPLTEQMGHTTPQRTTQEVTATITASTEIGFSETTR